MYILAVDDERIMLNELTYELQKVFPNADIHSERNPQKAIEWVKELREGGHTLEYAFMDIWWTGIVPHLQQSRLP